MKEKGKEQIVAKVLKEVVKEKEGQGKEEGQVKEEVKLKQMEGGRDLNVTLGKVVKEGVVDAEVVAKVKKGLDLSKRSTKKFLKIMRQGKVKALRFNRGMGATIQGFISAMFSPVWTRPGDNVMVTLDPIHQCTMEKTWQI